MTLRKSLLQWGGFVIIAVGLTVSLGSIGILDSFLVGMVVAILYLPVFNYLYKETARSPLGVAESTEKGKRQGVKVVVHHDRLTRSSSLGMMLLGLFTLLFVSGFIGIILIVIGFVMYRYYRRQTVRALQGSGPRV